MDPTNPTNLATELVTAPGDDGVELALDPQLTVHVEGDDADDVLSRARTAAEADAQVVVSPDGLFRNDRGEIDLEAWIAFCATLVVIGVAAFETGIPKHARRLFVTHSAITSGSTSR